MKVVAIIQARMGSSRLPAKVMAQAAGKSLIRHQIERLGRSETVDAIVVAIPRGTGDDPLASEVCKAGALLWRGDEYDVLGRVIDAARAYEAELIVELTGDCPLIDPEIVDRVVAEYFRWRYDVKKEMEFLTTTRDVVSPQVAYPRGMDVRVFPATILDTLELNARTAREREHVTLYVWEHQKEFDIHQVYAPEELRDDVRLTVDAPEDLTLVREIFEYFGEIARYDFTLGDILALLDLSPEMREINANVEQKVA